MALGSGVRLMTDEEWALDQQHHHNRESFRRNNRQPPPVTVRRRHTFTEQQMAIAIAVAEKHEMEEIK